MNSKKTHRRMPMPPINFQAIEIERLETMLDRPTAEGDDQEPDW